MESSPEAKGSETKKLAKMNSDGKIKYEFEKRTQELAEPEAEVNKRKLTAEVMC